MVDPTPVVPSQPVEEPVALTDAQNEQLDVLYAQLNPEAVVAARSYIQSRTPMELQAAMADKINADFPLPEPAPAPVPPPASEPVEPVTPPVEPVEPVTPPLP